MNYPTYLEELERILSSLTEDDMKAYIEEKAMAVGEGERNEVLASLSSFCGTRREKSSEKKDDDDTAMEIEGILKKLDGINSGRRIIDSRYNEEWLETQSDEIEAYDFFDSDKVIDDLEKAVSLLHKAVDREVYEKGALLALKLTSLEVEVDGVCPDGPLSLDMLCSYKVINRDFDTILRELLYLVYKGESGFRRQAELMVTIMNNFKHYEVSLEDILERGEKENVAQSFLPFWIDALMEKPSHNTDKLLEEAVSMMDDREAAL